MFRDRTTIDRAPININSFMNILTMEYLVCTGPLESLRHLKKEINEARKGSECGMVVDGFKDVKEGDQIVSITKVEKAQQL